MLHLEPGDITDLIHSGLFEESVELEAKRSSGSVPQNAWESISAFANGAGGYLVLGIEETDDAWRATGVSNPNRMIQDIHNLMRDHSKISCEVVRNGDIWKKSIEGAQIVVVRVAPASRRNKPVFIKGDRNLAYVRRNEGDARCTNEELDRMRREGTPESSDVRVLPYLTLDDFDLDAVERYRLLSLESLANHMLDSAQYLQSVEAGPRA